MPERTSIDRLLQPRTVAIVGLSDNSTRLLEGLGRTFESDCEIFIVNPRYERVMGRPAARSLTDLGQPIDSVFSVVSGERTTELAEEAAGLGIGGMVLVAAGFAEIGPEGARLQERLRAAGLAGGFAGIGPNGLGYEDVHRGVRLSIAVRERHNVGGISVVSQSGAVLTGVTMAGNAAGAGFNLLISAGNEAISDLADFVDYLADDERTTAIAVVMEKIRRPEAFFRAVRRAIANGKPVGVLKLARTERTQRMAASHTGSLTSNAWAYDVALRQAGVAIARDADELADRLLLFDKIPSSRWTAVRALGVVTRTGGFASLTYDVADQEGVVVPPLDDQLPWIQELIPGALVPNPVDTTGLGGKHYRDIVERYITSPDLDAFFQPQPMSLIEEHARPMLTELAEIAATVSKPVVVTNVHGAPPPWTREFDTGVLAFGGGVRESLRGLQTMGSFVRFREGLRAPLDAPAAVPRPATPALDGGMLPFDVTMRLLRGAGVPVAPYVLIGAEVDPAGIEIGFAGPLVAKLADVAHRTEHDAVRLDVTSEALPAAVEDLRGVARAAGLPPAVAVQPMLRSRGELLVGAQRTELGPMVVLGLGGVFVEALRRLGGRMAPFDGDEARDLVDEFRDVGVMHGFRGRDPWDLDGLARLLAQVGRLAAGSAGWLTSLDLNPVLYGDGGYTVVDGLVFVSQPDA